MIIPHGHQSGLASPVGLLALLPSTFALRMLWFLDPGVIHQHGPVVVKVYVLDLVILVVFFVEFHDPTGDSSTDGLGLSHDTPATDDDIDVELVDTVASEFEGLENLQSSDLGLIDLQRDLVDPDPALPFGGGGTCNGCLSLAACVYDLVLLFCHSFTSITPHS
jgi:hypothetical protein